MHHDPARGRAIAARRLRQGHASQRSASREAGLANTTWARYESGAPIGADALNAVERVLGIKVDDLSSEVPGDVTPHRDVDERQATRRVLAAVGAAVEVLLDAAVLDGEEDLAELRDELRAALRAVQ